MTIVCIVVSLPFCVGVRSSLCWAACGLDTPDLEYHLFDKAFHTCLDTFKQHNLRFWNIHHEIPNYIDLRKRCVQKLIINKIASCSSPPCIHTHDGTRTFRCRSFQFSRRRAASRALLSSSPCGLQVRTFLTSRYPRPAIVRLPLYNM